MMELHWDFWLRYKRVLAMECFLLFLPLSIFLPLVLEEARVRIWHPVKLGEITAPILELNVCFLLRLLQNVVLNLIFLCVENVSVVEVGWEVP
jgi:hypothetical protein